MKIHTVDSRKLPKPHNATVQAQLEQDEAWFRTNPAARFRNRPYRLGELGPGVYFSPRTWLLIVRLEPFVFVKLPINGRVGSSR